jgi:hypothetical protein
MKAKVNFLLSLLMAGMFGSLVSAQISISPAVDIYSNYLWRGSKFGTGPSVQPSVALKSGGITVGVWGAFDAAGYTESDLYASYATSFGLTVGATDYYYPNLKYFDYSDTSGSHAFEANIGYSIKSFSISANYIFNEAGGAASMGGDKYFELGYAFSVASVFVGVGDGWHTSDTKFGVCNVGVKSTKEIKVTETFTVPVTGIVVFNPEKEQLSVVVGFSF